MQLAALLLIIAAAIPATVFPFAYAWIARGIWWRVPAGWALIVSTSSLALLLDLSLLFRMVALPLLAGQIITLAIVGLIALGAWLKLGALLYEHRQQRRSVPPLP